MPCETTSGQLSRCFISYMILNCVFYHERNVVLTKQHPLHIEKSTLNVEEKLADQPKDSAMNCNDKTLSDQC